MNETPQRRSAIAKHIIILNLNIENLPKKTNNPIKIAHPTIEREEDMVMMISRTFVRVRKIGYLEHGLEMERTGFGLAPPSPNC
jgi:hypothetical protein